MGSGGRGSIPLPRPNRSPHRRPFALSLPLLRKAPAVQLHEVVVEHQLGSGGTAEAVYEHVDEAGVDRQVQASGEEIAGDGVDRGGALI